jgi:hypothetical protein
MPSLHLVLLAPLQLGNYERPRRHLDDMVLHCSAVGVRDQARCRDTAASVLPGSLLCVLFFKIVNLTVRRILIRRRELIQFIDKPDPETVQLQLL